MLHLANYAEFELYLPDKYFETIASKIGTFLPVWPLWSQKNWPLTFSSITTKRYIVDRSNYTFSESLSQEESVGMVFDNIEAILNLTPVQTILWPPGFLYRMWPGSNMKWWSLDPYQRNEIIKPFVSFQLSKRS